MTAQRALFDASIILNLCLIASMFYCGLWRSHRVIFILQTVLFLETPLFLLSGPELYAHLWPTIDKLNLVIVLAYARYCCEDFAEVSALLGLCLVLKLCAWSDIDPEGLYVPNLYHYLRIYADLAATIVFIVAIHRRKGEQDAPSEESSRRT